MDSVGDSQWLVQGDPWVPGHLQVVGRVRGHLCLGLQSRLLQHHGAGGVRSVPDSLPEEAWQSVKKRVLGLEAAISAMVSDGIDETSPEVTLLKESL